MTGPIKNSPFDKIASVVVPQKMGKIEEFKRTVAQDEIQKSEGEKSSKGIPQDSSHPLPVPPKPLTARDEGGEGGGEPKGTTPPQDPVKTFSSVASTFSTMRDQNPEALDVLVNTLAQKYTSQTPPLSQDQAQAQAKLDAMQTVKSFYGANGLKIEGKFDANLVAMASMGALSELNAKGDVKVSTSDMGKVASTLTGPYAQVAKDSQMGAKFDELHSGNSSVMALVNAYRDQNLAAGQDEASALLNARKSAYQAIQNHLDENELSMPKAGQFSVNVGAAVGNVLNQMVEGGKITADKVLSYQAQALMGKAFASWVGALESMPSELDGKAISQGFNTVFNALDGFGGQIEQMKKVVQSMNLPGNQAVDLLSYLTTISAAIDKMKKSMMDIQEQLAKRANERSDLKIQLAKDSFNSAMEQIKKQMEQAEAAKPNPWIKYGLPILAAIVALVAAVLVPFTMGASLVLIVVMVALTIALTVVTTVLSMTGVMEKAVKAMTEKLMDALGKDMPPWAKKLITGLIILAVVVAVAVATIFGGGAIAASLGGQIAAQLIVQFAVQFSLTILTTSGALQLMLQAGIDQMGNEPPSWWKGIFGDKAKEGWSGLKMALNIALTVLIMIVSIVLSRQAGNIAGGLTKLVGKAAEEAANAVKVSEQLQKVIDMAEQIKTKAQAISMAAKGAVDATGSIYQGVVDLKQAEKTKEIGKLAEMIVLFQQMIAQLEKLLLEVLGGGKGGTKVEGSMDALSKYIQSLDESFKMMLQGLEQIMSRMKAA